MAKTVAIGVQDFAKLRERGNFYVDKTNFIREWWKSDDEVTLITRPRRFGKTLNMSMLEYFFSNKYENRGDLFEGLSIWEDEEFRRLQGSYPVVFLTFADVKETDYRGAKKSMNYVISEIFNRFEWITHEDFFSDSDRVYFDSIRPDMDESTAARSIKRLCEWLYSFYGKKVLIFLDEYDTPMQEAYVGGYWDEMTAYIRSLFNSTFKTNPYLERAVMTGITRVSKESIFSDLNNLTVVTTTSDEYATGFGFTEEEVFASMDSQGFDPVEKEHVKRWYDGFTFGSVTDIYNPWSVTMFLKTGKYDTHWANTSGNGLVGKLIREGDSDIKVCFETLLRGECIEAEIDEQIIYNQLDDDENAIWSLLLASGYLKVEGIIREEREDTPVYRLTLTNFEVKKMFEKMVAGWFRKGKALSRFVSAMLRGDIREMNAYMNKVALNTFSYFDVGKNASETKEPERFYHGFVLGLMVEQADHYTVKSNRESGFGRYDVVMEPKDPKDVAVIMEFKVLDKFYGEKTLEDTAANALAQIEEKKYDADLLSRGIPPERIFKFGFAFEGEECLIMKQSLE